MLKSKKIDIVCIVACLISIIITILFMNGKNLGIKEKMPIMPYVTKIFDNSKVHTVDIIVEEEKWNDLLTFASVEEYINCNLVIDGECIYNVGVRTKGNNSLNLISKYNSNRFSLKVEFDHFDDSLSYYGLDKISLNTSFQDNAYLKDYITYDMMAKMGVPSPLCSYAYVKVNGEDFGLFVAIEEVEEAFAKRNFGIVHGELYKPDYINRDDENNDIALIYTDESFGSYDNIFRNAKFNIHDDDKKRLIKSLKQLSLEKDIHEVIDIDEVIRYFVVQVFVVNLDSYLGKNGHNYYLYEEEGKLSLIPWDYNLAYATYPLGISPPINDSTLFVNYPIDTPCDEDILKRRPMFNNIMKKQEHHKLYYDYFSEFIEEYFESGYFSEKINNTKKLISPYVKIDPTKFCSYEDFLLAVDTFEKFCELRALSVQGQFMGTIPSTMEGQLNDKSNLIDGSHIWIPDLGELSDMYN